MSLLTQRKAVSLQSALTLRFRSRRRLTEACDRHVTVIVEATMLALGLDHIAIVVHVPMPDIVFHNGSF